MEAERDYLGARRALSWRFTLDTWGDAKARFELSREVGQACKSTRACDLGNAFPTERQSTSREGQTDLKKQFAECRTAVSASFMDRARRAGKFLLPHFSGEDPPCSHCST